MSDTQQQIVLQQRQRQQRQILAMMGIGQWVQPTSPTLNIADIPELEVDSTIGISNGVDTDVNGRIIDHTDNNSVKQLLPNDQQPSTSQPVSIDSASDERYSDYDLATTQPFSSADSVNNIEEQVYTQDTASLPALSPVPLATEMSSVSQVSQTIEPLLESITVQTPAEISMTVAPFDLQAGRYGNWVLLVDIQALSNDSQQLWQNITQALSISCETSSFPICAGMDTAELANASLAGYLFKIGRSEDIQVAVLTVLPEGLTHPNFVSVPTLDEMLIDASYKRQLWQQLASLQ
ncbi:hypothetical protein ES754_03135 [Psychrobacter frigidicola]|uniref:DNA polymerase III subunit psi n=1 Tax=Psychrobacter frigidicola TaxID=45611 RepID=A0A5C7A5L1_9GAMM|nr:hypothetical protein [Psychrobacter frigidicola]TXD97965.1 hypothetical protein ES754_03135 [Psychrobacter frigidicola]